MKPAGDRVAARYPGKIVVLLRHVPGDRPAGDAFAGLDHAFIVMPGTEDASHRGHPHTDALAHEIGHYLGLPHTFAGSPLPDVAAAESFFVEHVLLGGVELRLPRNMMAYYGERDSLWPKYSRRGALAG